MEVGFAAEKPYRWWGRPFATTLPIAAETEAAVSLQSRRNVSLIGVHGPVGRGTHHPSKQQPVGSVLAIEDEQDAFITVEGATQIRGLQFWYPRQTLRDPAAVIEYPATIRASQTSPAQGVTLSCLTFYGEFTAMDFRSRVRRAVAVGTSYSSVETAN